MNKQAKHTPAPWYADPFKVTNDDGYTIADCVNAGNTAISWDEKQANAILIAAAPDLLEAAEQVVQCYLSPRPPADLSGVEAILTLQDACLKARGTESHPTRQTLPETLTGSTGAITE